MKNFLSGHVRRHTNDMDRFLESKNRVQAIATLTTQVEYWNMQAARPFSFFKDDDTAIMHHMENLLKLVNDQNLEPSYAVAKLAQIEAHDEEYAVYDSPPKN